MTLRQCRKKPQTISASWYLADIMEARGRQDLYLRQSPQRLKVLRDHALIESAVSSNRMEGVQIEASRLAAVMRSNTSPRDRDEEEIRGYRNALNLIHSKGANLPFNEETILKLHYLSRGIPATLVNTTRSPTAISSSTAPMAVSVFAFTLSPQGALLALFAKCLSYENSALKTDGSIH